MKSKFNLFLSILILFSSTVFAGERKLEVFQIHTEDVELKELCSEQQNCFNALDIKVQELGQDVSAIVDKIKEQTPEKFTYGEDAEIAKFKADLKEQVELCHRESIKLRLAKDAQSEATDEDKSEGESGVGTWLSDGAINLFYWYWKSDKGKQEYIRDEIKNEVSNVAIIKDYLTPEQIITIADRVSKENLVSKDPLENKFKLIQESYKSFTDAIIQSVLKSNCLSDPEMVEEVTGDFKKCIDDSYTQKNIDKCQSKFEQSVGYRVGDKILDQLIKDNFSSQKPIGWDEKKWLLLLKDKARASYNSCADEWFLAQKREDPNDIQVCAYQGVSTAFKETIKYKVDEALTETVPESEIREKIVQNSIEKFQCPMGEKLRSSTHWGKSEWDKMVKVSPDNFKEGLNQCVDNLTILAGRNATNYVMNHHPSIDDVFKNNPEDKPQFVDGVMDHAYNACIEQQQKEIRLLNDKVVMPKDSCTPAPELASVDPALCEERIVMEATTQLVTKGVIDNISETVKDLYPTEQQKKEMAKLVDGVQPILSSCKKEASKTAEKNLSMSINGAKQSPDVWEKKYLQCVSAAIGLVAYEVSEPTLLKELGENEATGKYDLTIPDTDIEKFRKEVSQCYSSKVAALDNVDQLSSSLEAVSNECALAGKKSIMPAILPLVLDVNFKAYYKDDKRRAEMVKGVMNSPSNDLNFSWRTVFSTAKSDQDIDLLTKQFQTRATAIVFGDLLIENLNSFYPTDTKDPVAAERNAKIQRDLILKYVGYEFENKMNTLSDTESELYLDEQQFAVARDIVVLVLEDNLKDNISDPQVVKQLLGSLKRDFNNCINRHKGKKDKEGRKIESSAIISLCTDDVKINAYKEIGFRVMRNKIKENISMEKYANNTIGHLKARLNQCLEKAKGKKGNAFDNHLDGCLSDNALIISRDIGDFTILQYSRALNTQYSEDQMKKYLADTQRYAKGVIPNPPKVNHKDPAIYAHSVFNNCIDSIQEGILDRAGYRRASARVVRNDVEAAMTKSDVKIGEVTDKLDGCAGKYEEAIIKGLRERFVGFDYPNKHPDLKDDLDRAFDLMMLLRGKPAQGAEPSNPEGTWKQLALIGERTVVACNYDKEKCKFYMEQTRKKLEAFRKAYPHATDDELLAQFYASPYMKFVVRSSIAEQVRSELMTGVADYKDSDGLLETSVDNITSSALMEKALQTTSGKNVVARVLEMIKEDKMDDVGKDPVVRKNLTQALTKESPRFVDGLMYGLVEPQLRKEKRSPSFTTRIGYFLGIVKKSSLDWNKLKDTKHGIKARQYFEDKLLIPLFNGEDIPDDDMDKRTKTLTDKIVTAAKKAS